MEKRSPKVDAVVRVNAVAELENVALETGTFVGKTAEGLVFETAEGIAFVVKVVIKQEGFDAQFECADFAETSAKKEAEKVAKAEKAKARKNGAVKVVKPAKEGA